MLGSVSLFYIIGKIRLELFFIRCSVGLTVKPSGLTFSLGKIFEYLSSFFDDVRLNGHKIYCIILESVLVRYPFLGMCLLI